MLSIEKNYGQFGFDMNDVWEKFKESLKCQECGGKIVEEVIQGEKTRQYCENCQLLRIWWLKIKKWPAEMFIEVYFMLLEVIWEYYYLFPSFQPFTFEQVWSSLDKFEKKSWKKQG